MGIVNVTPDSFSDGGRFAGTEAGGRARPGAGPPGRRPARRRRRIDPARRAPGRRRGGAAPRRCRWCAGLAAQARRAAVGGHLQGGGGPAGLAAGAHVVNDVTALARRPRHAGGGGRDVGAGVIADAHAGHAADDAAATRTTTTSWPTVGGFFEERLQALQRAGYSGDAGGARPRHRLRQDGRAQPGTAGPAGRIAASGPAGLPGRVAQGIPRPAARPAAATNAWPARWPRLLTPWRAARPRSSRVHDVGRDPRRRAGVRRRCRNGNAYPF